MTEQPPALDLYDDGAVRWSRVDPGLAGVRRVATSVVLAPLTLAAVVVAATVWRWAAVPAVVLLLLWAWAWWLVGRQVSAMSYAELPDELVIRKGRIFRTLVTIPYGRIQYVDVEAGPLLRRAGLAEVEVHTANPQSAGSIPGLPEPVAHRLRESLSSLGESRRAGL